MIARRNKPPSDDLRNALLALVDLCGGTFAAVMDGGVGVWCVSPQTSIGALESELFYQREVKPRARLLRSGSHLSMQNLDGPPWYVAESFASIYVLAVWFDSSFELESVRAWVRQELPRIEALTVSLPPVGGPGADAGARKLRG
jgi:hypothetical protein